MDAKTTFIYESLEDKVYMDQPEGFTLDGNEQMVCKLRNQYTDLNKLPLNGISSLIISLLLSVLKKTLLIGVYT